MGRFKGVIRPCDECGAEFRVPLRRADTARFCCRKCTDLYRAKKARIVTLLCVVCGKPFQDLKSHAGRRKYCSKACQHGAARRKLAIACEVCGKGLLLKASHAGKRKFCSVKCAAIAHGVTSRKRVMLSCAGCGGTFEERTCHAHRRRYCSRKCQVASAAFRARCSDGKRGSDNPAWIGGIIGTTEGYVCKRDSSHPFAQVNGYILQHRLVMEKWLQEHDPDSRFLIKLGDRFYLSPEYEVHHKDEIRNHNTIDNLQCVTHADHQKIHAELRRAAAH